MAQAQKLGFLVLPPEIRNKVYGFVIPSTRGLVLGNHPQKELQQYKQGHRGTKAPKFPYRLHLVMLSKEDRAKLAAAAAFLRVCRVVNREMTGLLYSSTTFCFTTIKHINKFLNTIPEAGKIAVTKIEISYSAYGEPLWTKDEFWKMKSDWKWTMACARIKSELPALRSVRLGLRLSDWPLRLSPYAGCFWPLEILKGSGLERARVHLSHSRYHPDRCAVVARDLEDMMMTAEGRELRDLEEAIEAVHLMQELEAQKSQRQHRRARRVLVIKNIPPMNKPSTITPYGIH